MMNIYDKLRSHRLEKGANRALLSFMMNEITIDGKPIDDNKAKKIFEGLRKKAVSNIKLYLKAEKLEKVKEEEEFIDYLDRYLPAQASKKDIVLAIEELDIERIPRNISQVVNYLKNEFEIVDGSLVREVLIE